MLKISVITPSLNQVSYLERALRSVHAQQGSFELEHVVVDGGSTDGSLEILERWKDRLSYRSAPDSGQSQALNTGVGRATGEVIGWLNADDLLAPGALDAVAQYFESHPHVLWAYGRCRIVDEDDQEIRRGVTRYKRLLGGRYSYSTLLLENYISQPATFFRRSLYEKVGGVEESLEYDQDYDLWLRFGRVADAGTIDADLAAFRFHAAGKTGGRFVESLRAANRTSRRYARLSGKPWLGEINAWWYYRRTALIYTIMGWRQPFSRQKAGR
jgi:glycosyltransferase involved in cell wall biosynthesis